MLNNNANKCSKETCEIPKEVFYIHCYFLGLLSGFISYLIFRL
jgi:hypothetical protein